MTKLFLLLFLSLLLLGCVEEKVIQEKQVDFDVCAFEFCNEACKEVMPKDSVSYFSYAKMHDWFDKNGYSTTCVCEACRYGGKVVGELNGIILYENEDICLVSVKIDTVVPFDYCESDSSG